MIVMYGVVTRLEGAGREPGRVAEPGPDRIPGGYGDPLASSSARPWTSGLGKR
jgi:hypothetical protein